MDILLLFLTGLSIGFSGAMIPGPLTLFTVSESLRTNGFAGLKTITGHIVVEFAVILAICLGFHKLLSSDIFLSVIFLIGGIAFIIMGTLLIMNSGRMKLSDMHVNSGFDKGQVIGGAFFSIVSPGFIVWWITIGVSTLTNAILSGLTGVIFLILGHWLADVIWYGSLSYAANRGKTYISDDMYRSIMRMFALILILIGIYYMFFRKY